MFNPHPDRKWLRLREHATSMEHVERVAGTMTDRQHDMIGGNDLTTFQFHRADPPGAVLTGGDVDTDDLGVEPIFAAKLLYLGPECLDDRDQPERADVRLAGPKISSGPPAATNSVSTLRPRSRASLIPL